MTTILSAVLIVERRWATITVVRPLLTCHDWRHKNKLFLKYLSTSISFTRGEIKKYLKCRPGEDLRITPPPLALWPNAGHGLLILEVSRSHTTTYQIRWDPSGWVISSSQRPLPDNTQHSQQTSMPPVGFEPTISAGERPQNYTFDRTATGTGWE